MKRLWAGLIISILFASPSFAHYKRHHHHVVKLVASKSSSFNPGGGHGAAVGAFALGFIGCFFEEKLTNMYHRKEVLKKRGYTRRDEQGDVLACLLPVPVWDKEQKRIVLLGRWLVDQSWKGKADKMIVFKNAPIRSE